MGIIVQKFGGTSVADLERIRHVASLVKKELMQGKQVVAVVSAMAGVTNSLITRCNELSRLDEINALTEYDAAIASGEIVTAALLAIQLQTLGVQAKSLQGWQVPINTSNLHGNSQITKLNPRKLRELLKEGITPVITGFQGVSDAGNITTLGKGGSDTSAAVIAAALKAERCDIYTDVNGIYTADPRVVHDAKKINEIDIDQLYALCSAGAKVLHPRAALAAKRYGFTLRVLSSFDSCLGTTTKSKTKIMENRKVTAITSNKNLLKIDVDHDPSSFTNILKSFSQALIPVEQSYSFGKGFSVIIANLIDKNKCEKLLGNLKNNLTITKYSVSANISSITIVGYGIKNDAGFIGGITQLLNDKGIEVLSTDISDIKMSFLVDDKHNEQVIKLLHEYCF
ncbi:MAG: aspartate kinase [Rickettsiaceae bacterium]